MPISDLSDLELERFEAAYRRKKQTDGGRYSLREILLERKRRSPTPFGVREVASKILELAAASKDGLVSYGDIWKSFRPDVPWKGHQSQTVMSNTLRRVIYYCVSNGLPILTVLVVRTQDRRLSAEAIDNIYNECRELGVDVGPSPAAFIKHQIELSRAVVINQLPQAD